MMLLRSFTFVEMHMQTASTVALYTCQCRACTRGPVQSRLVAHPLALRLLVLRYSKFVEVVSAYCITSGLYTLLGLVCDTVLMGDRRSQPLGMRTSALQPHSC